MKMLDAIDKNVNPTIFGDGSEALILWLLICARANICAMKSDIVDNYYNVGTGVKLSLKELAELIIELTNSKTEVEYKESSEKTLVKIELETLRKL